MLCRKGEYTWKFTAFTWARQSVPLIVGDGSERGEYVDQDYILAKMGRPHRSISLMYCYYPLDEGWPGRCQRGTRQP